MNETDDNKTDLDELDKLRIENSTHITKDSEGLDMNVFDITNVKCMRPQALYYPNRFLDSQAYMMVVHCPDEFRDKLTIDKCNAGMDGAALLDMIPVTSKLSGLTYKNKHCLMCNEKLQAEIFIEWRVEIVSNGVHREHFFFSSPDLIVEALIQKKMAFSNVNFKPGDESLTRPCEAFDIISCNETGLLDIYNEEMEALCLDGYQLAIISKIGEKPFTLKNIACLHCNTGSELSKERLSCEYWMNKLGLESSFSVKLNLRSLVSDDRNRKPVARAPYIEHDAIQQLSHRRCPAGKLYILVNYDLDHVKMQRGQDPPLHSPLVYEPRSENTGIRGFRPGPTQTGLYSHRRWLKA